MSAQPFASESYSGPSRDRAWQEVLGGFALRSVAARPPISAHASALFRASSLGLRLGTLSAEPQVLQPAHGASGPPLLILPQEGGGLLQAAEGDRILRSGQMLLGPRGGDWQLSFQRGLHAIVLAAPAEMFRGRTLALQNLSRPHILDREGVSGILAKAAEAAAGTLDRLSEMAWETVAQSAAELLLALATERASEAADASSSRVALLQRLYATIERRLGAASLSVAEIAQSEGISERYVQKLFEGSGDSFSQYLRERRLQRAWHDLVDPACGAVSISEIAYRYGFSDSAHFSRLFRERFGLPPRELRRREAEQERAAGAAPNVQRGWPQQALARLRARPARGEDEAPGAAARPMRREGAARTPGHHHLAVDAGTVHWGYFSRSLKPVLAIESGDLVTVETLTQHASDDPERMIRGDAGAENVFRWTATEKAVNRRGAGPLDASVLGRGAGEGFGVHICTGPIAVRGAEPGDVLEVRIVDIAPRRSQNPAYAGRVFGSSVAAWWGYHYGEFLSEPRPRETVTIYEIFPDGDAPHARAVHAFRWEPQTDPNGVRHALYDYPGVPVDPATVTRRRPVLSGIRIPLRPHFGVIAVAPREADLVDSVPPAYFGGNLDNWRLGKGAAVYLPVSVAGALLSVGDPHAAQGDGELSGTAIECSMTGTFRVVLHKRADTGGTPLGDLTYPLIETPEHWVLTGFSHPNYLAEFGAHGQSDVYSKSSLDLAMRDAFRKVRRFLMANMNLDEDEAIALMSAAVDFGITQVVDGNWGVHAMIDKAMFRGPQGAP
ncbi:acetamidase/formamidase family protein [Methylobacterium organophilum]|uniref:acetamidase/formamidase family protein n=1 Tax=Methylobacterium organophilum TaxID=410 RepID=UPI001F12AD8E|nr:acetamidase/formamidase family protein [Methylobacterium organophilum]UMY18637.1 acetamidase/formamidase family protein [Methylobacterium organophilum]